MDRRTFFMGPLASANLLAEGPQGPTPPMATPMVGDRLFATATRTGEPGANDNDNVAARLRDDLSSTREATKGDALLGVKRSAASAVATTQHVLNESRALDPGADFGCDNTGSTDCSAALQACLLAARRGQHEVRFAAGAYLFSSPLLIDWSHSRFTFAGNVTLRYTGSSAFAVAIDGGASGALWDVQFGRGGGPRVEAPGTTSALFVRSAHHSHIEYECTAALVRALLVNFSVCTRFIVGVSRNRAAFVQRPVNGMQLDARGKGEGVADCVFDNCIIEGVKGDGIVATFAESCTFVGGTSEGNGGGGYVESNSSKRNLLINFFCEENQGADFTLNGSDTQLVRVTAASSAKPSRVSGARNVLGGRFFRLDIQPGASHTVLDNALLYERQAGGSFSDQGTQTVYRDVKKVGTHAIPVPDTFRAPRLKNVGPMKVFAASQEPKCVVKIGSSGLEFGDSLRFEITSGMTQLNGNTYQVEPLGDTLDGFYILNRGVYVDSSAFTAFSSGTATFIALAGGWTAGGAPFRAPGFSRDASGLVQLHGTIKGGVVDTVAFTLPPGLRPAGKLAFACMDMSTPGVARVSVSASGEVRPEVAGSPTCVALDGVSFRAED